MYDTALVTITSLKCPSNHKYRLKRFHKGLIAKLAAPNWFHEKHLSMTEKKGLTSSMHIIRARLHHSGVKILGIYEN